IQPTFSVPANPSKSSEPPSAITHLQTFISHFSANNQSQHPNASHSLNLPTTTANGSKLLLASSLAKPVGAVSLFCFMIKVKIASSLSSALPRPTIFPDCSAAKCKFAASTPANPTLAIWNQHPSSSRASATSPSSNHQQISNPKSL